jgi:hypothetical protein
MMDHRMMEPLWALVGRALIKPIMFVAVGLVMLFESYRVFGPIEDSLGFMRRNLTDQICTEAAEDLPQRQGVATLAILDLAGDSSDRYISNMLRQRVQATGKYRLIEESFFRKLLREFGKDAAPISRLTDAVVTARQLGVDAVLFGEIPEFTARKDGAALKLELRMAERDSGQAVFVRSYASQKGDTFRARVADSSKGRRIFVWIMFTFLLPLVTVPLIRRLTSIDSNLMNLGLLLGYTLLDMFVAVLLTGFWIPTLWTAGILLLALAGSGYYNYRIASFIEQMKH